jgi:putative endonuclease
VAENAEIDIIAKDGDATVFIEVKTRSYKEPSPATYRAASAVTKQKQRKIIECARIYLSHHFDATRVRFDVIEVYAPEGTATVNPEIFHMEDAFQ